MITKLKLSDFSPISTSFLRLANFFAKYSVSRWNKHRLVRIICRKAYQTMSAISTLRYKILTGYYPEYPWPYSDPNFAPWEEDDDTLVVDPARFVIRRSTSYCAWKIRTITGKWPTKREQPRYDARDWGEFLELNGATKIEEPSKKIFLKILYDPEKSKRICIGVAPDEGKFGQLYILEGICLQLLSSYPQGTSSCYCSTYRDFHLETSATVEVPSPQMTWYVIYRPTFTKRIKSRIKALLQKSTS